MHYMRVHVGWAFSSILICLSISSIGFGSSKYLFPEKGPDRKKELNGLSTLVLKSRYLSEMPGVYPIYRL